MLVSSLQFLSMPPALAAVTKGGRGSVRKNPLTTNARAKNRNELQEAVFDQQPQLPD